MRVGDLKGQAIMNNAKRGKISPFQFFAILTVSRIVVSLTYIQSVTVGIMSFDIALGLIFAAFSQ